MKKFIKNITDLQFIKVSFLSGFSTFIKILIGLVSVKVLAVYIGPSGIAKLGQFTNLVNIITVIAGGGISIGVVKYVAEFSQSQNKLRIFLNNALSYTLFFSLSTMLVGCIFRQRISLLIFNSSDYAYLICWLSIVQFFISLNLLLYAILNGLQQIGRLVTANIIGSIIGLAIISLLSIFYETQGALLAVILSQSITFFVTFGLIVRQKWSSYFLNFKFKTTYISKLSRYSFMNIISSIAIPAAQISVRSHLEKLFTWHDVGLWQSVLRISDAYLVFITMILTAYYLPKLSQATTKKVLKQEILKAHTWIIPLILFITLLVYLSRNLIIHILYTPDFLAAKNLFLFQLVGDFFRIAGWLLTYLLLAKTRTKTYISTEIIVGILFISISYFMVRQFNLIGVTYSFAITYFLYWLLMFGITIFFFKRKLKLH